MRSFYGPCDIFDGQMRQASQAIGWAQDDPRCKQAAPRTLTYKGPDHGITDSKVTQYVHNMRATHMEAILRYEG